jgi:hypothetical protein
VIEEGECRQAVVTDCDVSGTVDAYRCLRILEDMSSDTAAWIHMGMHSIATDRSFGKNGCAVDFCTYADTRCLP